MTHCVLPSATLSGDSRTRTYGEPEKPPLGPAYLEVVRGASATGVIQLQQTVTLGRDEDCEGRFPVTGVSRRHARVVREAAGGLRLVDLGSRNGTFLNGRRVEQAELRSGDELRMGPVVLRLRLVGDGRDALSSNAGTEAQAQLSPREREVAELVAEGLTNAEIGDRLGISGGTVGRHLANIYRRLEIHSRAALARLVSGAP